MQKNRLWIMQTRREKARHRTKCKPRYRRTKMRASHWFCTYNKALEFWNSFDTYNPDIIIGTESWLREEVGNTEIFRTDFTTFRRDRHARGGGVFICVKNNIACSELWVNDEFEITAVEIKGSDPRCTWEIVGIYRAPNKDILIIEIWLHEPVFWEIPRNVALYEAI